MNKLKQALDSIYRLQKESIILEQTEALVDWDQNVYMPEDSVDDSAEKSAFLSKLAHETFVSKEMAASTEYLIKPENFSMLKEKEQKIVERLHKDLQKKSRIPSAFVAKEAKTSSKAQAAWKKAKKEDKFEIFEPHLEKIVELAKEKSKIIGLPGHPYNSLLDGFEEGMTVDKLQESFSYLGKELTKLLKKIQTTTVYKNQTPLKGTFSEAKQEKLTRKVMEFMGMPKGMTRLDTAEHPFTTSIGNKDVRITTRYMKTNPLKSLDSTIHEAGHALYELGLPDEYMYTVIRQHASLGIHESQSIFWENIIGKSKSFLSYVIPEFQNTFKRQVKGLTKEDLYKKFNQVRPSLIRTESDELTFCQHVILRYQIELGLIEGTIKVKDLPDVWNQKMQDFLGVTPSTNREGVLQDIHWSFGAIGYFPTYALGSIYAAQLNKQIQKENPDFHKEIKSGNLETTLGWLRKNVHSQGRLLTADEIIKNTCGEGLNPEVHLEYLHNKYSSIYGF